jgi:transposase-like protein
MSSKQPAPAKRAWTRDEKRAWVERVESGELAFGDARKKLGIQGYQFKAWWGQVRDAGSSSDSLAGTQDVMRRLIRDVADGKIGDGSLRLAVFDMIVNSVRHDR